MKKLSVVIASFVLVFGLSNVVSAQGNDSNSASHTLSVKIPEVALVDIEGTSGTGIVLEPTTTALEAGSPVSFTAATNSGLWLNYTSIVGTGKTRKINVALDNALPEGLSIELVAAEAHGHTGNAGTAEPLTLSTTGQSLISNIGSVFTGQGTGKGHNLTYTLKMDNTKYGTLVSKTTELTVTYTITDGTGS